MTLEASFLILYKGVLLVIDQLCLLANLGLEWASDLCSGKSLATQIRNLSRWNNYGLHEEEGLLPRNSGRSRTNGPFDPSNVRVRPMGEPQQATTYLFPFHVWFGKKRKRNKALWKKRNKRREHLWYTKEVRLLLLLWIRTSKPRIPLTKVRNISTGIAIPPYLSAKVVLVLSPFRYGRRTKMGRRGRADRAGLINEFCRWPTGSRFNQIWFHMQLLAFILFKFKSYALILTDSLFSLLYLCTQLVFFIPLLIRLNCQLTSYPSCSNRA